ncbi:hypothetical protein MTR_6g088650 [Medicago truncatula]|uniref:Uncharacterized protein n=1 Tax=Medicago truncatula TaxID=3880 RepID=G7KPX3_MEDTR|nr:hypothetical protein MTR_6g088650 [Medicago truncatula]
MVNIDGKKLTWIPTTPVKPSVSKSVVFYNFRDPHARQKRTSQNDLAKKLEKDETQQNKYISDNFDNIVESVNVDLSLPSKENHKPNEGNNNLNKTPGKDPWRKKHRLKVIIEGNSKRTLKIATPKPA